jgi:hypothetical protein
MKLHALPRHAHKPPMAHRAEVYAPAWEAALFPVLVILAVLFWWMPVR